MVVVSFSTMRPRIEDGRKRQTIRPVRSDHWLKLKEGDYLQLYWKVRKSKEKKKHHFLKEVKLSEDPFQIVFLSKLKIVPLSKDVKNHKEMARWRKNLAQRDGFDGVPDMTDWFYSNYGEEMFDIPFVVLRW